MIFLVCANANGICIRLTEINFVELYTISALQLGHLQVGSVWIAPRQASDAMSSFPFRSSSVDLKFYEECFRKCKVRNDVTLPE